MGKAEESRVGATERGEHKDSVRARQVQISAASKKPRPYGDLKFTVRTRMGGTSGGWEVDNSIQELTFPGPHCDRQ